VTVPRREFEKLLLGRAGVAEFYVEPTAEGADVSITTQGTCDTERLRVDLVDMLARHGVAAPEVSVREVTEPHRLWTGKMGPFAPVP
jgi:hypothetical protein